MESDTLLVRPLGTSRVAQRGRKVLLCWSAFCYGYKALKINNFKEWRYILTHSLRDFNGAMVNGFLDLGPVGGQNIMVGSEWQARLLTSWRMGRRWRDWIPNISPTRVLWQPSTRLCFLKTEYHPSAAWAGGQAFHPQPLEPISDPSHNIPQTPLWQQLRVGSMETGSPNGKQSAGNGSFYLNRSSVSTWIIENWLQVKSTKTTS